MKFIKYVREQLVERLALDFCVMLHRRRVVVRVSVCCKEPVGQDPKRASVHCIHSDPIFALMVCRTQLSRYVWLLVTVGLGPRLGV